MIYAVNILPSANLGLVLSQLAGIGAVSQPHPRTPRYVELDAPPGWGAAIEAITGVCGCCDADEPVTLTLIEPQAAGFWHIGDVSGDPQAEYGRDTGQFYLADVPPNVALIPDCELIFNPSADYGNHGTGTADAARRVWTSHIYAAECFSPSGSGTVSTVTAGINAIADHREDSGWAGVAVCNCSFTSSGANNPYSAIMQRLTDLGVLIVASTGNDGVNITTTPRWPALGADYAVGAVNSSHVRPSWSNWPADVYAGGDGCDFLIADGSFLSGVGGTSISSPVFAMALRRALDEGKDGAWLLAQSRLIATNVPGGSVAVLTYPTQEVTPPPPPPPSTEDFFVQIIHNGIATSVPDQSITPLAWDSGSGGVTDIPIPSGATHVEVRAVVSVSSSLATGKTVNIRVHDKNGALVKGAFDQDKISAGVGSTYLRVTSPVIPVQPGDTFRVLGWHNQGANVDFLHDANQCWVEVRAV